MNRIAFLDGRSSHPCLVPNCPRIVHPQHAMCSGHWQQLPDHFKKELLSAWSRSLRRPGYHAIPSEEWRHVARAAVKCIEEKLLQPLRC